MNIETTIRADLWAEISASYEVCDYRNSIINAMHVLTKILREKADSDLDGHKLAGEALGGKNPKLKVNRFQTQSEIDEQEGFTQIVMGLYRGIRNPRSHEIVIDTKNDADAIICFINYVINLIDKSNPTFTVDDFLTRIFDPDFVENEVYVAALVSEIPKKKLGEVLIRIFRERKSQSLVKIKLLTKHIIGLLTEADINDYVKVVSEELQKESDHHSIIAALNMISPDLWTKIKKTTKIRIENKLIKDIGEGEIIYKSLTFRNSDGVLGTWASTLIASFEPSSKEELAIVLRTKAIDYDIEDNLYVVFYFLHKLPNIFNEVDDITTFAEMIERMLNRGASLVGRKVYNFIYGRNDQWKSRFVETLSDFTDPDAPSYLLEDGTPFLGKEKNILYREVDDDIPF